MTKPTKKKAEKNSSTASLSHDTIDITHGSSMEARAAGNSTVTQGKNGDVFRALRDIGNLIYAFLVTNDTLLFEVSRMDEEISLKKLLDTYLRQHPRPATAKDHAREDFDDDDDDNIDPDKLIVSKQALIKMFQDVTEKLSPFGGDVGAFEDVQQTERSTNPAAIQNQEPIQTVPIVSSALHKQLILSQGFSANQEFPVNAHHETQNTTRPPDNNDSILKKSTEDVNRIQSNSVGENDAAENRVMESVLVDNRQGDVVSQPQNLEHETIQPIITVPREKMANMDHTLSSKQPHRLSPKSERRSLSTSNPRETLRMPQNIIQIQTNVPKLPPKYANPLLEEIPVSIRSKLTTSFSSKAKNLSLSTNENTAVKLPRVDRVPIAMYHASSRRHPLVEEDRINGSRHPVSYLKAIGPRRAHNPAPSNTLAPALCIKPVQ